MKDLNGKEIKEGDTLTFDWFDCENPIEDMRRKFNSMKEWTDEKISNRINQPTFIVKKNDKGRLYGEGIEDKGRGRKLYLHSFRFGYTKIVSES